MKGRDERYIYVRERGEIYIKGWEKKYIYEREREE